MQAFYGTRLSEHISETPEGFLVAHGAALARTAVAKPQQYRGSELGLQHDELVDVYRSAEEVLSKKFLASLNGKPVTDAHPTEFLNVENNRWYAKGHVQNAKVGPRLPNGEQAVVGDLVITDAALIAKIKSGTRDLSVGYQCSYQPRGDGSYEQRSLRANHVAVVDRGRAGEHVRIMDREVEEDYAEVARAYHRVPNAATVATERANRARRRIHDSVSAEMLSAGEPRSFDELAEEIRERMSPQREEEIPMSNKLTDDEMDSIMARIVAALEKLEARQREEVEPDEQEEERLEEIADASPALLKLRKLRPVIEASGDRKAIDSYNTAVKALRKQSRYRGEIVQAADWWRKVPDDPGSEFERAARKAGARMRGEPDEPTDRRLAVHAEDATARDDDEAWGRRMMREGKRRRGEKEAVPETQSRVTRHTEDSEESFEDVCARRREELRNS